MDGMTSTQPSVFTRIIRREIPAEVVYEDDRVIAFNDIAPQAPVHVVVVPKTEDYRDVVELAAADPGLLAHLVEVAKRIADERAGGEFRLIFNNGQSAGQTIFHAHAHVLGGPLTEGTLGSQ
jgi:histidine triad (HIT) family protein